MLKGILPRVLKGAASQLGVLPQINVVVPTVVDGQSVQVPFFGGRALRPGKELWMTDLLRKLLPLQPGRFVDVGVNLGQTLLKVKVVEPERAYVGFEPNPLCVSYVRDLIRENRFVDVDIVPAGLYVRNEIMTLLLYSEKSGVEGTASIIGEFRPNKPVRERLHVPVVTWETAARSIGDAPVGVFKVDVEGAEVEVLTTLQAAIERDQPLVLLEVLPASATNTMRLERQASIESLVRGLKYVIHRVAKTEDGRLRGLTPIETFGVHSDLSQCDYVLVPAAATAKVQKLLVT